MKLYIKMHASSFLLTVVFSTCETALNSLELSEDTQCRFCSWNREKNPTKIWSRALFVVILENHIALTRL